MGLAGVLLGATWFAREPWRARLRELFGRRLLFGVVLTFGAGIAIWYFLPVIDNWGHLGGFLTGFALSLAHRTPDRPQGPATKALGGFLAALTLASFGWMAVAGGDASSAEGEIRMFKVLLADDPENPLLFALYSDPTREEDASLLLEAWVARDPADPNALNALAWHLVTRRAKRDPVRALELVDVGLAHHEPIDLSRAAYLDTRAEALIQLGRLPEALVSQQRAVDVLGDEPFPEREEMIERLERIRGAIAVLTSGVAAIDSQAGATRD